MAKPLLTWTFSVLLGLATAEQPSAPRPVAAPMRSLPWGDLNFMQTTDTHGWHAGHLQEPQYSADWGDYISFAERIREQADRRGADLLLIDTGDRIEGNGLYDGSSPKGEFFYDIVKEQHIDVITTGNHELYQADAAAREYDLTVPNFEGRYLASNLDYINPNTGETIPMAQRFRKFTTKNRGIRVVAFGFLFNFNGNANNTVVQKVEDTIKEQWFQDAIREPCDLFLVIGHVTLDGPEYKALYAAIRDQNWDTPIQFFGGHSHIRSFAKYDSKAYALQAGRYFETIGWMSIQGIGSNPQDHGGELKKRGSMTFQRRYIDNNLFGYHYHTGLDEKTFPTEHGKNVSAMIRSARKDLKLDHSFGCAPRDLWLSRAPYPSENSIFTWLETEVLPAVVKNDTRKNIPTLALTNTGTLRFDIFKGAFTKDTTYIISPFVSKFRYIKDVPYEAAKRILSLINNEDKVLSTTGLNAAYLAPPEQISIQQDIIAPSPLSSSTDGKEPPLIPGYTTKDAFGTDGDDTIHSPISHYQVPNCIQVPLSFPISEQPEKVDVVFVDFIQPWILLALKYSGADYGVEDVDLYTQETLTELMAGWIEKNWGKDC
ncbi:hypothetical protein HYFRA_00003171 [Hymenoscyphus fraxineus]|uniref:Putative 5'-nucleotidase C-terminal domain-containing protein n=1 Tax=Hymenoscyphus fraxineus TaxID=746836 RepID=A0A9N9KTU4_9HELO|nr:hypothetical protein HYFRA_00003171 [Hymenoscyphus fraxineus]